MGYKSCITLRTQATPNLWEFWYIFHIMGNAGFISSTVWSGLGFGVQGSRFRVHPGAALHLHLASHVIMEFRCLWEVEFQVSSDPRLGYALRLRGIAGALKPCGLVVG